VARKSLFEKEKSMNILVTGSNGFVGSNLCAGLACLKNVRLIKCDVDTPATVLEEALTVADVIFHLAGVNRPLNNEEFEKVNAGFTDKICRKLVALKRSPKMVLSSSIQAELDNPYGRSKRAAEKCIENYSEQMGAAGVAYRLKNLFGKWCRPNYNSVTATFCYNIAHDMPVQISDPANVVDLTYIDDVAGAFLGELDESRMRSGYRLAAPLPSYKISLEELSSLIGSFRRHRKTLLLPDFADPFVRALYATFLSYLKPDDFSYNLDIKSDNRGNLAEFLKTKPFGQLFISRTKPGIIRGDHYHHTKTEKFLVVAGHAVVRFRDIRNGNVVEYSVRGEEYKVVDIPPGYSHSIENIGPDELVTLFWSSEIFDPTKPDTNHLKVLE
jgi:UDP-2-acetamido-2,6-beta-L-arabino-hexul-4-ose reductase